MSLTKFINQNRIQELNGEYLNFVIEFSYKNLSA